MIYTTWDIISSKKLHDSFNIIYCIPCGILKSNTHTQPLLSCRGLSIGKAGCNKIASSNTGHRNTTFVFNRLQHWLAKDHAQSGLVVMPLNWALKSSVPGLKMFLGSAITRGRSTCRPQCQNGRSYVSPFRRLVFYLPQKTSHWNSVCWIGKNPIGFGKDEGSALEKVWR